MTTTEQVSSGIYQIDLAGADKPQCLTHTERNVTILPVVVPPDPNQQVIHRLCVELSLTSHFSGKSTLKMKTSLSRSPPRSSRRLTLVTMALPRNQRQTTGSCCKLLNFPRTNGTSSQLHLELMLSSQSTVSFFLAYYRVDSPRAAFVSQVLISVLRLPHPIFFHPLYVSFQL